MLRIGRSSRRAVKYQVTISRQLLREFEFFLYVLGGNRSADPSTQGEADPGDGGAHLLPNQIWRAQQSARSAILLRWGPFR
jgi:hypothetical protein